MSKDPFGGLPSMPLRAGESAKEENMKSSTKKVVG